MAASGRLAQGVPDAGPVSDNPWAYSDEDDAADDCRPAVYRAQASPPSPAVDHLNRTNAAGLGVPSAVQHKNREAGECRDKWTNSAPRSSGETEAYRGASPGAASAAHPDQRQEDEGRGRVATSRQRSLAPRPESDIQSSSSCPRHTKDMLKPKPAQESEHVTGTPMASRARNGEGPPRAPTTQPVYQDSTPEDLGKSKTSPDPAAASRKVRESPRDLRGTPRAHQEHSGGVDPGVSVPDLRSKSAGRAAKEGSHRDGGAGGAVKESGRRDGGARRVYQEQGAEEVGKSKAGPCAASVSMRKATKDVGSKTSLPTSAERKLTSKSSSDLLSAMATTTADRGKPTPASESKSKSADLGKSKTVARTGKELPATTSDAAPASKAVKESRSASGGSVAATDAVASEAVARTAISAKNAREVLSKSAREFSTPPLAGKKGKGLLSKSSNALLDRDDRSQDELGGAGPVCIADSRAGAEILLGSLSVYHEDSVKSTVSMRGSKSGSSAKAGQGEMPGNASRSDQSECERQGRGRKAGALVGSPVVEGAEGSQGKSRQRQPPSVDRQSKDGDGCDLAKGKGENVGSDGRGAPMKHPGDPDTENRSFRGGQASANNQGSKGAAQRQPSGSGSASGAAIGTGVASAERSQKPEAVAEVAGDQQQQQQQHAHAQVPVGVPAGDLALSRIANAPVAQRKPLVRSLEEDDAADEAEAQRIANSALQKRILVRVDAYSRRESELYKLRKSGKEGLAFKVVIEDSDDEDEDGSDDTKNDEKMGSEGQGSRGPSRAGGASTPISGAAISFSGAKSMRKQPLPGHEGGRNGSKSMRKGTPPGPQSPPLKSCLKKKGVKGRQSSRKKVHFKDSISVRMFAPDA